MTKENVIITPTYLLRKNRFTIESAAELYTLSPEKLLTLEFKKYNNDPNDKLYLFPAYCYDMIPDDFIVEEIYKIKYTINRRFVKFKYDTNFTKNNNAAWEKSYFEFIRDFSHKQYLDIGININYTYNELIIKDLIE